MTSVISTESQTTISNLSPGTVYTIRVVAFNLELVSLPSENLTQISGKVSIATRYSNHNNTVHKSFNNMPN